jgi:tetratricopeptide (TPR) repeat protein
VPSQSKAAAAARCEEFSDELFQTLSAEEVALLTAGEDSFNAENFVIAAEIYERLLALNPGLPGNWTCLGNTYAKLGQIEKAWAIQERGHQLFPCDPVMLYNMGNIKLDESVTLHNSGDSSGSQRAVGAAIHYFQESLRLEPRRASFHYNLALAYSINRDPIGACKSMRRALNLNPTLKLPPGWNIEQQS